MTPPRRFSALPPADFNEASPKAISGRTSYLRVRLEFLRYPRLIATFFNRCAFEPPPSFTTASFCPWVGHTVSGLPMPTCALFRLGLPQAPCLKHLTCQHRQLAGPFYKKYAVVLIIELPQLVDTGFQVLFHSPPGVLFTFPSRYYTLSVTE